MRKRLVHQARIKGGRVRVRVSNPWVRERMNENEWERNKTLTNKRITVKIVQNQWMKGLKRDERNKRRDGGLTASERDGNMFVCLFPSVRSWDLLLTPFLPLRSFLYCSFSRVIRLWSTSQASPGLCSSFSIRHTHTHTDAHFKHACCVTNKPKKRPLKRKWSRKVPWASCLAPSQREGPHALLIKSRTGYDVGLFTDIKTLNSTSILCCRKILPQQQLLLFVSFCIQRKGWMY